MKKKFILLFSLSCLLVFGWGCVKPMSNNQVPSGPKPLILNELTPAEMSKKIIPTAGSIVLLKQTFTETAEELAARRGLGKEATRKIVIRRFAPLVRADIEWATETSVTKKDEKSGDEKNENIHQSGAILDIDLLSSHDLYLPNFWIEGEKSALNTGGLWLARDVFENFEKTKNSTFTFGLVNKEHLDAMKLPVSDPFNVALQKLNDEVKQIIAKKDVFLSKADPDFFEYPLKVNDQDVKVQVMKIRNWFGEILVLNNEQNPLVLQLKLDDVAKGLLGDYFDYQIVELRDFLE